MPDSFTLSNQPAQPAAPQNQPAPAEPSSAPAPEAMKLSDVVYQQQDAIVFDGSRIPSVQSAQDAFIIFYLTLQDEENGYGTVIQLDPTTKQAAIFADLNPEYTYLFYKDEQQQLQTLLWCIEFATRTNDGLYITQAKVHGKGVTEADMRHLGQIKAPNAESGQQHPLPEQDSVMPAQPPQPPLQTPSASPATPQSAPTTQTTSMSSPIGVNERDSTLPKPPSFDKPANIEPAAPTINQSLPAFQAGNLSEPATPSGQANLTSDTLTTPEPSLNLPPLPDSNPDSTLAPANQPTTELPSSNSASQSGQSMADQPMQPEPAPELQLPPLPDLNIQAPSPNIDPLPQPKPDWSQPRPPAPTPSTSAPPQLTEQDWAAEPLVPNKPAEPLPLPPLPDLPSVPPPTIASDKPIQFTKPDVSTPPAFAPVNDSPFGSATSQAKPFEPTAQPVNQEANAKNPVGRPPKPLTADAAWMIEPQDFNWLKTISRDPWSNHQDEIRQKLIKQIRKNKPNLIDDWQFHGVLEQAFQAVGQTYELVPSLRHDLLKALMNGKVVDQVLKQMRDQ